MVVATIKKLLNTDEFVIIEKSGVFTFPNQSVVGVKSFYITNKGRVYAHDSGGLFGEEKYIKYENKINVTLNRLGFELKSIKNMKNTSLSFNFTLDIKTFLKIYQDSKVKIGIFEFVNSPLIMGLISTAFSGINFEDYYIREFKIEEDGINIIQSFFDPILFSRVRDYKINKEFITLNGFFNLSEETVTSIRLFIPDQTARDEIIYSIDNTANLFSIVPNPLEVYKIDIEETSTEFSALFKPIIVFSEDTIYLIDDKENALITSFDISEHQYFYSEVTQQLLIKSQTSIEEISLWLNLHDPLSENLIEKLSLSGDSLLSVDCYIPASSIAENKELLLTIDNTYLYVFSKENFNLLKTIPFATSTMLIDKFKCFLMNEEEIFLIESFEMERLLSYFPDSLLTSKMNHSIGYSESNVPFYVEHSEVETKFLQTSQKVILSFKNNEVELLEVADASTEKSNFCEIKVQIKGNKQYQFHIIKEEVANLTYRTYFHSKQPLLPKVSSEQLFLSYSRQANDFINYQFFAPLLILHSSLKEVLQSDSSSEIRNLTLVNHLYYSIQGIKKHLDKVSIYLPPMLEEEENQILKDHGHPMSTQQYKYLQKNLLNTSAQINRSLNEMENSLSAVSFALIDRISFDSLTEKQVIRGYTTAGLTAAIGVIAFPPLLMVSLITGLNSYFNQKDAVERKRIQQQNENYRLDFHVEKIMASYDHFIEVLLPYYISEVNTAFFQAHQQTYKDYKQILDSDNTRIYLFEKIAQYYTYKQLPVAQSIALPKKNLIFEIDEVLSSADNMVKEFKWEVESVVPKSIEI